jgi:hypothetical protein
MTWKAQIKKKYHQAKRHMAIMKKWAGTNWGADEKMFRKLYAGRVRPSSE